MQVPDLLFLVAFVGPGDEWRVGLSSLIIQPMPPRPTAAAWVQQRNSVTATGLPEGW